MGCRGKKTEVVVFYASSLSAVLGDLAEAYQRQHPQVKIRLEPSGSQVAARKVTELGMRPDLVAVADANLLRKMMIPTHSRFNLIFATNEIVLAHKDHSRYTDQITARNWPELLTRTDVRLGRADPDTAPIGYLTLMVWQLSEKLGQGEAMVANLFSRLKEKCAKEHVTQDEAELLALLESRAIDYAFLFRSTAEDHRLKIISLPEEINLSRPDMAKDYAQAKVVIRMRQGEGESRIVGAPITYGVTIPNQAPHAVEAARFLAFWLGDEGGRHFVRRGFHRLLPARCDPCTDLPKELTLFLQGPPS
jgi:molybdate/tungstate transport system substrate-binding protein